MEASYKRHENRAKNPVEFALRCASAHVSMLYGILEEHGDQERIKLNHELSEILDNALEYLSSGVDLTEGKISVDIERIRTLLRVLTRAEYEFVTTNNLWVTDRPDLVPNEIRFKTNYGSIIQAIRLSISEMEKLGNIRSLDCFLCKPQNMNL